MCGPSSANHYHLILRNRPDLAAQWTDEEVVRRWWRLCPERKDEQGRPAEPTELEIQSLLSDPAQVAEYRKRLRSVSWFMKSLNEWFSQRTNAEEGLHGHFWEERFKCRNLLDVGAILACSIYVDLNEIRADLAATPENSPNTSAYRRILARILRQARAEAGGSGVSREATDYQNNATFVTSRGKSWFSRRFRALSHHRNNRKNRRRFRPRGGSLPPCRTKTPGLATGLSVAPTHTRATQSQSRRRASPDAGLACGRSRDRLAGQTYTFLRVQVPFLGSLGSSSPMLGQLAARGYRC